MRIRKSDLGHLEVINSGAYGCVYRAPGYQLPGVAAALAYKEFTSEVDTQARAAEKAVAFRQLTLSAAQRAALDRHAVWPLAGVEDDHGTVTGFVMTLIPGDFFFDTTDPFDDAPVKALREIQFLIADPATLAAQQLEEVDETDRLALLAQLCYVFRLLHRHGWVYGDLSFMNAAYAVHPVDPPRLVLLDCDAAAAESDAGRKQAHSIGWKPPECAQVNVQDTVSDAYKLGLAIMRCLNPGVEGIATLTDPRLIAGKLDPAGERLVARAVGKDRAARPTAKELYSYLHGVVAARTAPPEVIMAQLATPMRARGMDARVEWQIRNVQEVVIQVGSSPPETVQATGDPQSHVWQPERSGPVTIEAANRFGRVRVDLGELTLYELPRFDPASFIGTLPRPGVPAISAFGMDALAPALATVPRVPLPEMPQLPVVPTADLTAVLRSTLLPAGDLGTGLRITGMAESLRLPDLGALVEEPTRQVHELMTTLAKDYAETQRESFKDKAIAHNAKDEGE